MVFIRILWSSITSRVSSKIWCGAILRVCHVRADSAVWLPLTSSNWPWSGTPKVRLYDTFLGGLRQSWGITPLLVLNLVTKVATEGSATGTVPHLAIADVGESAKSDVVGMVMAKDGVGLKRTCFLESGGWEVEANMWYADVWCCVCKPLQGNQDPACFGILGQI